MENDKFLRIRTLCGLLWNISKMELFRSSKRKDIEAQLSEMEHTFDDIYNALEASYMLINMHVSTSAIVYRVST